MKRRFAAVLAAVLASAGIYTTAAPAEAANCVLVAGRAHLGKKITAFPTVTLNVPFTLTADCETGGSITASGTLTSASCGKSEGRGSIVGASAAGFNIQTAGTMLVLTGTAKGGGNATVDVLAGDSCAPGGAGADDFIITGAVKYK